LEQGRAPSSDVRDDATRQRQLLIGADGMMAPFRPQERTSKGATRWREVKVGILVGLGAARFGVISATLAHGGAVFLLASGLW
jgi:hypothetical protein